MKKHSKSVHINKDDSVRKQLKSDNDFVVDIKEEDEEEEQDEREEDEEEEEEEEETNACKSDAEKDINIIRNVIQQLPKTDNIPYNERLEQINWGKIEEDDTNIYNNIARFNTLLSKVRKIRSLTDILREVEKDLLSSLKLPKKSTPFALFVKDHKDEIRKKIKETTFSSRRGNFARFASEMFRQLPKEEKDKYSKESGKIKKNYGDSLAKMKLEVKCAPQKKYLKIQPKIKDGTFKFFWEAKVEENPNVSAEEIKQSYANLSNKKKLNWILRFLNVEKGDMLNLEQYKLAKNKLPKKEMNIIDEYEGRPKKMHGYNYFFKQYFNNHGNVSSTDKWNCAVNAWNLLSKEEKAIYEKTAKQSKKEYTMRYFTFIKSLEPKRMAYEAEQEIIKNNKSSKEINSNSTESFADENEMQEESEKSEDDSTPNATDDDDLETLNIEKIEKKRKHKESNVSENNSTTKITKRMKTEKSQKEIEEHSLLDISEVKEDKNESSNSLFNAPSPKKIKNRNSARIEMVRESISKKKKQKKYSTSETE